MTAVNLADEEFRRAMTELPVTPLPLGQEIFSYLYSAAEAIDRARHAEEADDEIDRRSLGRTIGHALYHVFDAINRAGLAGEVAGEVARQIAVRS